MIYEDPIYGKEEIIEPVLLHLIASTALQRAKGVSQHGITALIDITPPFSRFDHCLGTMLLVRRLGAALDEQIAALLHDISHTAFSHVIDYVFDDHDGQNYHEEKKEEFVANTDIPDILKRHGFDWRDVIDEEQFSLLEQPAPALCGDRLDYFLRDLKFLKLATHDEIYNALGALEIADGQIVVNNSDTAKWLAYTYIETDRASWSNFREVGLYQVTAEAIKSGRRHGLIKESDIWESDEDLWCKLQAIDHPEVRHWVKLISPGTRFIRDENKPDFTVSTKVRTIDPPVRSGKSICPLSEIDPAFRQFREDYIAGKKGPWPMRIVSSPCQHR